MEQDLFDRLSRLKDRQMELYRRGTTHDLTDEEHAQLALLRAEMDEVWDAIRRERVARAS